YFGSPVSHWILKCAWGERKSAAYTVLKLTREVKQFRCRGLGVQAEVSVRPCIYGTEWLK
ncbi:hypothetical protein BaRGS_00023732, partial [Batillaria attramentaria]